MSLGFGFSLPAALNYVSSAFSPLSLFSGGAPGAWYDPSDYGATGTLFQDSAGTTPVTAVEQPVGLMLDKSQGLVLGSELVTNGTFDTGISGWTNGSTAGGSISWNSGGWINLVNATGNGIADQSFATIVGTTYKVTVSNTTTSAVWVFIGSTAGNNNLLNDNFAGIASKQYVFTATTTTSYLRLANLAAGTTTGADNISIKALPGNHAFQATSASRPVLSARYNLLTKTEQFDDAAWTKTSVTVTANQAVAPDGTTTADLVYPTTSGTGRYVNRDTTGQTTGTSFTTRIGIKTAGIGFAYVYNVQGNSLLYVNLSTGATSNVGSNISNLTSSIDANGWVTVSFNSTLTAGGTASWYVGPCDASGSTTVTANGTNGIYLWGADLRVANNGITQPAYQRVNTATDYNTTGFLPYLKFDGVDDSLSTNSISFTSTDKMSVFAGVRKLSDAATAILMELSAVTDANNGSFSIFHPLSGAGSAFLIQGTSSVYYTPTLTASPVTSVLSMVGNIAGATKADVVKPRVNGTLVQSGGAGTTAGTGNFGNYPFYIGRRNNASLPFNGQMYSMIIVGKAVTAGELSSTETYVNSKTGVVLA